MDQVPFGASEFADNPEPRCPCLLLLDTSASMEGEVMEEFSRGLAAFEDEASADALAMKRVELGIVSFGPVRVLADAGPIPAAAVQRSTASGVDAELSRASAATCRARRSTTVPTTTRPWSWPRGGGPRHVGRVAAAGGGGG